MKLEFSGHIFEKVVQSNFTKIRPLVADLTHADGRYDEQKENKWS